MNKLIIIGNLTRDPESRVTSEGRTVCNFTVAVNRRRRTQNQPDADFFRVAAWDKRGETCQQYLAKGRKVCVTGSVSVSTYQAQDGSTRANLEVFADDVEFLSSGNQAGEQQAVPEETPAADAQAGGFTAVETDELPFDSGLAHP